MMKPIPFVLSVLLLSNCTWSEDNDPLGNHSTAIASQETPSESAPDQSWQDFKPDRAPCPSILEKSSVSEWPQVEEVDHRNDPSPSNDYHLVGEPEHPACVLGRHARIASVRIDAIVRDYMNPLTGTNNWTVYRLEVSQAHKGGALPRYVYAAAVTGICSWTSGTRQNCRSYSTALRRVGETGIALLDSLGYDPIYAQAQLAEENVRTTVIPARVLSFGVFLPAKVNGYLDLARESRLLKRLVGEEASASELLSHISSTESVECPQRPSVCGNCDTSEICLGRSFDPPCGCINDWAGCKTLPEEENQFCRIHDPTN